MFSIEYIIFLTCEGENSTRLVFTLSLKVVGYNDEGQYIIHRVLTVNM